ncbi:DUF3267 domain-containing protein [Kaistella flava (ex Peng et al. 2021)]|uniref:DUF3267 domain-containing protein n=1 Tax=Kaistella flava (ex Peng et al. 2021) TaxID=2038776 RepID=A0A7M2YCS0_9FLAO|nr:DUF3267 domain-containing protein [Kaistella flava (ex Peng et al. 2021)]QOW11173.1 DUF3267 domain-containing protein [Kaistella flava (ex Peng et al. 2021)]
MDFNNLVKEKKIIDLQKANGEALKYLVLFVVVFAVPFYFIWGFELPKLNSEYLILKALTPLIILLLGIVAHELIHGIFFALYASKGIKSITFGILWKTLTPYCHCKEPLKIKHYIIALLAPLLILGVIPSVFGLIGGNGFFLIFGIFFSAAAAGDLMIYLLIRKENREDYVQDHPSEAGYYIFRKNKSEE